MHKQATVSLPPRNKWCPLLNVPPVSVRPRSSTIRSEFSPQGLHLSRLQAAGSLLSVPGSFSGLWFPLLPSTPPPHLFQHRYHFRSNCWVKGLALSTPGTVAGTHQVGIHQMFDQTNEQMRLIIKDLYCTPLTPALHCTLHFNMQGLPLFSFRNAGAKPPWALLCHSISRAPFVAQE